MKPTRTSTIAIGACTFLVGCTIETNIAVTYPDASSESEPTPEVDAGDGPAVDGSVCERGASTAPEQVDNVDILFMIDNSGSMAQEQARLTEKLSRLVKALASGDLEFGKENPRTDNYPGRHFAAPRSVHVGIVTSDLGSPPGVQTPSGPACAPSNGIPNGNGLLQTSGVIASIDQVDANTQTVTRPAVPACRQVALTPPYLEFGAGNTNGTQLDDRLFDFGCVATVGVQGCGIEQQLESVWKALAPGSTNDFLGPDTEGQGDRANAGFLRDDSVLAVVMVSDEDDCSVTEQGTVMFERTGPAGTPSVNVRCQLLQDDPAYRAGVHRTARYVDGLLSLRPNHPERLVFVGLVGLPQTDADYGEFDELLADPRMQHQISEESAGTDLKSVCGSDEGQDGAPGAGVAYPGRRYVEVAQGIAAAGGNAVLRPICDDDYSDVLDSLAQRIAVQLGSCAE